MMKHTTAKRVRKRGSGLLEFALGLPVLVLLFVGLAQLACTVYVYDRLASAVRAGARYAAKTAFDEPEYQFVGRVKNVVVYGNAMPDDGAAPLAVSLTTSNVAVRWTRDGAGVPQTITVSLNKYNLPVLLQRIELSGRPSVTMPYAGSWKTVPARDPR